jgi:hypothetical protein
MDAIKVFEIIKSRKYNRYKIQDSMELLKAIEYFTKQDRPIQLVGYWGVSNKPRIDKTDIETIEFLETINKRVKEIYPKGVYFNIIISDYHAYINNYSEVEVSNYISDLQKLFSRYNNVHILLLSELRNQIKLSSIKKINFTPSKKLLPILMNGARRMYQGDKLEDGIKIYYNTRIQEKEIFENLFSRCIFFTYNCPKYKELFPNLPILYLYTRKGTSCPPWVCTEQDA